MGVACDTCGVCPIVGPRFNSQVVMNYDLCGRCRAHSSADNVAPFRLVQNESGMPTSATLPCCLELLHSVGVKHPGPTGSETPDL